MDIDKINKIIEEPEEPEEEPEETPEPETKKVEIPAELKPLFEKLAKLETLSQEEVDMLAKIAAREESNKVRIVPVRRLPFDDGLAYRIRSMTEILHLPPRLLKDEEKELQQFNDDAYITSRILGVNPRSLKMWERFAASSSALRKALDTATAGEGQEWVPTALSADMIEKFRLESKVASLVQDIPMPSSPYELPFISGAITWYLIPESTSDSPSKATPSTPGTGKRTLTAKKLKARVLFSDELNEDSIVPVLPALKEETILAGAETLDDVIINGDTTAPHQDSDVTDSRDHRKAWKGLRKLCPAGTKVDLGTFNAANVRSIKKKLGKFGVRNTSALAWIAGITSYDALTGLTETLTVDKYGPSAVILNGELAKIFGIAIIVSEKIRENLNASGVYDGITTDNTLLMLFYRRGFCLGTRGVAKVNFLSGDLTAETDQNQLIISFKKAFVDRHDCSVSGNTTVGLGYNVAV